MPSEANGRRFEVAKSRPYLRYLTGYRLPWGLGNWVEATDEVHEALLKAHINHEQLRGHMEAEWRAGLAKQLATVLPVVWDACSGSASPSCPCWSGEPGVTAKRSRGTASCAISVRNSLRL